MSSGLQGAFERNDGPVTFYLPEADLDALRALDPDRHWREFLRGERVWILQTYLRLKHAGLPVLLSEHLPRAGVVVISGQRRKTLHLSRAQRRRLLIVATVQDLSFPAIADVQIVQDPRQAGPVHAMHVPHWPQPGLIPRDPSRGSRIERIEFKGTTENLHPGFRTERWRRQVSALGLTWNEDARPSEEVARDPSSVQWNDYRAVDLCLAVRPEGVVSRKGKPASKLVVSWFAGCPALLGPEPAFRELRRSELDYAEVAMPDEALRVIVALREDSSRYLAMIENGRARAAPYSIESLTRTWAELLFDKVPVLQRDAAFQRWRRTPLAVRRWSGLTSRRRLR